MISRGCQENFKSTPGPLPIITSRFSLIYLAPLIQYLLLSCHHEPALKGLPGNRKSVGRPQPLLKVPWRHFGRITGVSSLVIGSGNRAIGLRLELCALFCVFLWIF